MIMKNNSNKKLPLEECKIMVWQKPNRKERRNAKYLTTDFTFSEDETKAKIFKNIQEAELGLTISMNRNEIFPRPRIIVKS